MDQSPAGGAEKCPDAVGNLKQLTYKTNLKS
jgi:hypothetical protein